MKNYLLFFLFLTITAIATCSEPTPTPPALSTVDSIVSQVVVPAIHAVAPVLSTAAKADTSSNIWGIILSALGLLIGHKLIPSKLTSVTYYLKLGITWLKTIIGWVLEIVEALDATNLGTDPKFSKVAGIFKKTEEIANKVENIEAKVEPIVNMIDAAASANTPLTPGALSNIPKNPRL